MKERSFEKKPSCAPWLPEDLVIHPVSHGGGEATRSFRLRHMSKVSVTSGILEERIEVKSNPGEIMVRTIITPWGIQTCKIVAKEEDSSK